MSPGNPDIYASLLGLWCCVLQTNPKTKEIFLPGQFFDIKHTDSFKFIVKKLHDFNFTNLDIDVQGDAYQHFIKSLMTGQTLGKYFTPPLLKNIIIDLVNPSIVS